MEKLFGTDGVRGLANSELTPELAFTLGRAAAWHLAGKQGGEIYIGRDPRLSGAMLESALAAGIASVGINVRLVGVITTPGLAWLTRSSDAVAGAMISASHNPMEDNGIKFVNTWGIKLADSQEEAIEHLCLNQQQLPRPTGVNLGRIVRDEELVEKYVSALSETANGDFSSIRLVLDCANGAAWEIAPRVLAATGAQVHVINAKPDGCNINDHCGSTHPETVAAAVVSQQADLGLSLDGDSDRMIAVDASGNVVDGDKLMMIFARHMKEQGTLNHDTLVVTVMSNLGLHQAAEQLGINVATTPVGDRYVWEEMAKNDYSLGGEQSGHIIFRQHATTGDGLFSALQLLKIMADKKDSLAELASVMETLPQVLQNVRVAAKNGWEKDAAISQAIAWAEEQMAGRGRVLVRPSGTEPVIRVMLEGPDKKLLKELAGEIGKTIQQQLGRPQQKS